MAQFANAWLEHQRQRWTRHDAHRWRRCDAARYRRFDPRFHRGCTLDDFNAYNPDQPRAPAGSPEGGQWTTGTEGDDRLIPAQLRRNPRVPSIDDLLKQGWRSLGLGRDGSRVSIFVSRDVREEESFDAQTGRTIVSLTGIGRAIVIEDFGTEMIVSQHDVGTPANPDRGLRITIDADDNVTIEPTFEI